MAGGRPRLRASLTVGLIVVVLAIGMGSSVARAHGRTAGGGPPLDLGLIVLAVVTTGMVGGVIAAGGFVAPGRLDLHRRISRSIGPLLVILGSLAAVSAMTQRPVLAGGGIVIGVAGAGLLVERSDCQRCSDATVGAVLVHRLIEGVTLAAAYAVGSAIGLVGALVLVAHATAECVAVGGSYRSASRIRAVGAVVIVQAVFVGGAAIGSVATGGFPIPVRILTLGLVGGVLFVIGADDVVSDHDKGSSFTDGGTPRD